MQFYMFIGNIYVFICNVFIHILHFSFELSFPIDSYELFVKEISHLSDIGV